VTRLRITTHLPLTGEKIGATVWVGSIERGWIGKPLNPRKWNMTWRIGAVERNKT
jgi:hypothetical protein